MIRQDLAVGPSFRPQQLRDTPEDRVDPSSLPLPQKWELEIDRLSLDRWADDGGHCPSNEDT